MKNISINNKLILGLAFLIALGFASCKKFISVGPPDNTTNPEVVYSGDASAAAVLTGLYGKMSQGGFVGGPASVSLLLGLSSDELMLYNLQDQLYTAYYRNDLLNTSSSGLWTDFYANIYTLNAAIEGLVASHTLTPSIKNQLLGEAKFLRAFHYYYLVNLFGGIPISLSTDYKANTLLPRSPLANVYTQMITDLTEAQDLLNTDFLNPDILTVTQERVRPTKWAAKALLARVYLFNGEFDKAEAAASGVISETGRFQLINAENVFLKNSAEAIWQLQPVNFGQNTQDAILFRLPAEGPNNLTHPVYLSDPLVHSFESSDNRKLMWVDSVAVGATTYYYANKYKVSAFNEPVTEYPTVLRLAEQFLIRAECRARLNKISGAQKDLNAIRGRAGLLPTTDATTDELLDAIEEERRKELFTEWGHRWLDLKRTGRAEQVIGGIANLKGGTWQSTDQLYPLPLSELQKAPNLEQNPGY